MSSGDIILECKRRYQAGEEIESLIRYLRSSGHSKIESIATIAKACGVGLGAAKELVHRSATWQDRLESDDKFHANVAEAIDRMKVDD